MKNISPVLLVLQVAAVWLLAFAAYLNTQILSEGEQFVFAILCFAAGAMIVPFYQLCMWCAANRKQGAKRAADGNAALLRDVEDGVWPE